MSARALDITLTLLAAPLAVPVIAIAAGAAALSLRGNPLFLQERVGRGGTPFHIWKLRTMHHRRGSSPAMLVGDWKTFVFNPVGETDPRSTRIGRFLRASSLDELPNLVNVLRGEMSLVGPRPEIPEVVEQYPPEFHRRHAVRPGITGPAQVRGRSDLAYAEIIKYDLAYVDDHSLRQDLSILIETLRVAFRGLGAR